MTELDIEKCLGEWIIDFPTQDMNHFIDDLINNMYKIKNYYLEM